MICQYVMPDVEGSNVCGRIGSSFLSLRCTANTHVYSISLFLKLYFVQSSYYWIVAALQNLFSAFRTYVKFLYKLVKNANSCLCENIFCHIAKVLLLRLRNCNTLFGGIAFLQRKRFRLLLHISPWRGLSVVCLYHIRASYLHYSTNLDAIWQVGYACGIQWHIVLDKSESFYSLYSIFSQ